MASLPNTKQCSTLHYGEGLLGACPSRCLWSSVVDLNPKLTLSQRGPKAHHKLAILLTKSAPIHRCRIHNTTPALPFQIAQQMYCHCCS